MSVILGRRNKNKETEPSNSRWLCIIRNGDKMQHNLVIKIENVNLGKNKNWLDFQVSVGALDRNRKYTISYCGTELQHGLSLKDDEIEIFKRYLCDDFGFSPFNIKDIKRTLGTGKDYIIVRGKETNTDFF